MKADLSYVKLPDNQCKIVCVCGWETAPMRRGPFDPQEALVAAGVDHLICPGPKQAPMGADEYQRLALRTEVTPDFINPAYIAERKAKGTDGGLDARQLGRLIHALWGDVTEPAEATDMVKKAVIYGKPFDKVNILEECGDNLWYIALALDACGYTMEQAMRANIEKLKKRFPGKFSEEAAVNRDTVAERATLEEHAK